MALSGFAQIEADQQSDADQRAGNAEDRSPDSKIAVAENCKCLADFKNGPWLQSFRHHIA
jgi:hypothetical protein